MTVSRLVRSFFCLSVIFFIGSFMLLGGCQPREEALSQGATVTQAHDFETYRNQGLELKHPDYWTLVFDGTPDFSDIRTVVFDTSELSRVSLYIYPETGRSPSALADYYATQLALEEKPSIEAYNKSHIAIGNYEGLRLTWRETEMFARDVELTILKVRDKPSSLFAVFDLDEEDIEKEASNIEPVIRSINLK